MMREGKSNPTEAAQRLNPEQLREKFLDPAYLPTRKEVMRAFNEGGSEEKPNFGEAWRVFCNRPEAMVYEFLTQEFVKALTEYFIQRIQKYNGSEDRPLVILEIGAGNGRLTHFLQKSIDSILPNQARVIATDVDSNSNGFSVEVLEGEQALAKYQPDIVIYSWMPYRMDMTQAFRDTKSVKEYILIGETNVGACGDEWLTWGISKKEHAIPPFVADGFERENLAEISATQICRADNPAAAPYVPMHSKTVSFRRQKSDSHQK